MTNLDGKTQDKLFRNFYTHYLGSEQLLFESLTDIRNIKHRRKVTRIILYRLMFLWFLQVEGKFAQDCLYLIKKLLTYSEKNFYKFLTILFFEGINIEPNERSNDFNNMFDDLPYIPSNIFTPTKLEEQYADVISIPKRVFYKKGVKTLSIEKTPIFNLFAFYKWTTDENSTNEQKLSPKFLSYILELKANSKGTGTFFTPVVISTRMIEISILEYLKQKNIQVNGFEDIFNAENILVSRSIIKNLKKLKVVDPACGSGDFLIQMLAILEKIYRQLKTVGKNKEFSNRTEMRKFIITNNLYGVDISSEATTVTKMRLLFYLSTNLDNSEIDINIHKGNAVLGINKLPMDELSLIREEKRREIELQQKYSKRLMNKLSISDISIHQFNGKYSPLHWPLVFKDIFSRGKEGFDIVIGNPPYIRADSSDKSFQSYRKYTDTIYSTLYERWDLYIAFIELGFSILNKNGIMAFIISESFCTAKYASKIRTKVLQSQLFRIEFYPKISIFNNIGINNIILYLVNKQIENDHKTVRITYKSIEKRSNTEEFVLNDCKENIFRLKKSSSLILDEYNENTVPLGEICYISYGLRPNSDEIKYKGLFKKEDVISKEKMEQPCVPYIENKDIDRFLIKQRKWLEYGTERVPSKVARATFPELYSNKKLMIGKMGIRAIYDTNNLYANDSIIIALPFYLLNDVKNNTLNRRKNKENIIKGLEESKVYDLRYILGIINSKHTLEFINSIKRHRQDNYGYPDDIKRIPIYKANKKEQTLIINQVKSLENLKENLQMTTNSEQKSILQNRYSEKYEELNNLVKDLYI